ncbi:hypothetical protein ABZU32_01645 [Sphaerisporangium sp. NPDC005288]|uniref:hypothetical protein n=1 Tax=Sphaerisporangium sp. NPDC005288 TaxID=3155114 RepID=UPI0033AE6D3F
MRRRRRWALGGAAALVIAAVLGVAVAFPSVAAVACPGCYGLEDLGEGVYAEPETPAVRGERLLGVVREAERRVADFYGGRKSSPRVLACVTDGCYRRIGGGGERGVAVLNRAVMLSPRGLDVVIASHELSHVELRARLDGGDVPQWFNEGLAVLVSGDARYLAPAGSPDRCLVASDKALPAELGRWREAAGGDGNLYAEAACRVSRWVTANGGSRAVLSLIDRLNAGEEFDAVFRP